MVGAIVQGYAFMMRRWPYLTGLRWSRPAWAPLLPADTLSRPPRSTSSNRGSSRNWPVSRCGLPKSQAAVVIEALREHCFKVAMDDVGVGHSGLSQIKRLGVDTMKGDKFFVDTIVRKVRRIPRRL
jgi:hypothetical protein